MHYQEPPAAQIADMKHEVASSGNELRMTSTCVHVIYRREEEPSTPFVVNLV